MTYEINFNKDHDCFVWWHNGAGMSLDATTSATAQEEAADLADQGIYPHLAVVDDGCDVEDEDDQEETFNSLEFLTYQLENAEFGLDGIYY